MHLSICGYAIFVVFYVKLQLNYNAEFEKFHVNILKTYMKLAVKIL